MPYRVDTAVDEVEATGAEPSLDLLRGQPHPKELLPMDHTELAFCQPGKSFIRMRGRLYPSEG